ncbi:MAG: helix-turn-helix transcriptional regulator [Deltaproteobacteria bacterium]|nr:helix-turn-helix transcriptional regulator [Deltaproteobacteria bacterium]
MTERKRAGRLAAAMAKMAKERGDLFATECPSRSVLDHVTSRWGVLALIALQDGTHRFSELRRKIGGVSEKMLSQTLQALERDGLVLRVAHPVIPPHVDYSLTPMGSEVAAHVEALAEWIEQNMSRIAAARDQFEAAKVPCSRVRDA